MPLSHLQRLEAESIHIMREVVAEADNPVMLYSIGKDSAVMLHLALRAFFPAKPPFPLLHVDTTWKFRDMYAHRERVAREVGMRLIVHVNAEGARAQRQPVHARLGGLHRRDEDPGAAPGAGPVRLRRGVRRRAPRRGEVARQGAHLLACAARSHRWDPKSQRPELWKLYNTRKHKGESLRVFPLSNWTELDVWQYIYLRSIPIVPLYFARERPVVERDGRPDHGRRRAAAAARRRGAARCARCAFAPWAAIRSPARSSRTPRRLPAIIQEMLLTRASERQGRVIDFDAAGSMERKKREGYF